MPSRRRLPSPSKVGWGSVIFRLAMSDEVRVTLRKLLVSRPSRPASTESGPFGLTITTRMGSLNSGSGDYLVLKDFGFSCQRASALVLAHRGHFALMVLGC